MSVCASVQSGGSLPLLLPGNLAFDAAHAGGIINNGGDNVVLYDPAADEYIQLLYNGDGADSPPSDYDGFSATASRVGTVEDWGTDVDGVYMDWGSDEARKISNATVEELEAYDFAAGSMGPKVEAACAFVRETGKRAAIGSLADIEDIVAGTAGTIVENK